MTVRPAAEAIDILTQLCARAKPMGTAANLRIDPYLDGLRNNEAFMALLTKAEADPRLAPTIDQSAKATREGDQRK